MDCAHTNTGDTTKSKLIVNLIIRDCNRCAHTEPITSSGMGDTNSKAPSYVPWSADGAIGENPKPHQAPPCCIRPRV